MPSYHEFCVVDWCTFYFIYTCCIHIHVGVPEAPLNIGATAVLQSSENDCEILVKWDPPPNSVDITNYMLYVPTRNMKITTNSPIYSLLLRDCPESFGLIVAAVNRFGCIGINSSEVNVTLQPTPFVFGLSSESSKYKTSGDKNRLCGASLRESQYFFESIKAWGWYPKYNRMSVRCTSMLHIVVAFNNNNIIA